MPNPCEYTFKGKVMSEKEFKKLLLDDADLFAKAKAAPASVKAKLSQADIPEAGGEVKVGDYTVNATPIEMPDGEAGMKVTITKPDGETVDIGSTYTEDVASEVNKKIRGFDLSKTEKKTEVEEVKPAAKEEMIGKEIAFTTAGSDRKAKVVGIDKDGSYKVKDAKGINYTVKPEDAKDPVVFDEAKKSLDDNLKKLNALTKPKTEKEQQKPPTLNSIAPKDIITAPMKLLGIGDRLAANITSRIEDGIGMAFRAAMGNSNAALSRGASEVQGLWKMVALTGEDIVRRRLGLGQINAAPLKALNFYKNAVDIVGDTPESLRNVHMVLDPEVYTARGETPLTEAQLSPAEKNLYDLLRTMNDMIHDWHYTNGRISEEVYLKNKGTYTPRFYDNIEFEGYPADLKMAFEDYSKQQNFSYIKERQNFADVMGENEIYENPAYGTAMRLAQMMRNQAVMQYAAQINKAEKTYEEGDANIPNSYVKLEGGGTYKNINTYGELTNKYVSRDVAEDFKGYFFINQFANDILYKGAKIYDRNTVRQALKKSKTLYNPITQLGNIGSNYVFALMNGVDPLTFQTRKFEAARIVKEKGPLFLQLTEEGVLGSDIMTSDIKEAAKGKAPKTGIRGKLADIDDAISEFYGTRDEIAKIAAYLAHTKDYGRSHKEAVDRVYSGFQNYNNVGRFFDFAAKTPVVGNPFIKFKGDLLRIMKNNFSQRPLTNIALLGALHLAAEAFSNWSGEEDIVKEARERRAFIPKIPLPDAVGGDIPLVWQTPYGEINAARYYSPMNVYDMGERGSTIEDVTQFLPFQLKKSEETGLPNINIQDPVLGTYIQVLMNEDFRGAPIHDPQKTKWYEGNATTEQKIINSGIFVARQQIPFFSNVDDARRAYNGEPDYYRRNRDLQKALLSNVIKIEKMDKPEVIEKVNKEIDGYMYDLDVLNQQIGSSKSLAKKNIEKINAGSATPQQKQEQIAKQYKISQDRIAEIMEEQAEIKQKLLEPEKLLKDLGGTRTTKKGKGGKSMFKFNSKMKFGVK